LLRGEAPDIERGRKSSCVEERRQGTVFPGPPGNLMSAEIRTGPKIEATVPRKLFPYGDNNLFQNQFGVTADGKRFLIMDPVQRAGPSAEIMVVVNWAAELKQP